jgi:tRNA dimethylallyltransferase
MNDKNVFQGKLIVLAGPTASGKTDIAIKLATHFGAEIISADSRQFYNEIPVGTAAPTNVELSKVKHHFVGTMSITDNYNVSLYENQVMELLNTELADHPVVILTGGSGLYIDAVCTGIDLLPDVDENIRNHVKNIFNTSGIEALIAELEELDPEYLFQVDRNNPVRLMRAIEVCMQTGGKYSQLRLNSPKSRRFEIIKLAIDIPREILIERINHRTDSMMQSGWLKEVKSVYQYRNCNALNTVGYKELFLYLDGSMSLDNAIEKIKTNTRRYAKRQMTWFRRDNNIHWFCYMDTIGMKKYISSKL